MWLCLYVFRVSRRCLNLLVSFILSHLWESRFNTHKHTQTHMIYRVIRHRYELGVGQSGNNKSLFASEVLARYWTQHTATHDRKTMPRRPRIYDLLRRQSTPVAAQPDDKCAGMMGPIHMPSTGSVRAHSLNYCIVHLC